MKVNSSRDISFKSLYTNKALKKTLEFASDKPAIFAASASVGFSALRPLSIWITPNTNKENRKLACAKSITSSLLNLGIMIGISHPINAAIDKISKSPDKYLTNDSINYYKNGYKNINGSKRYIFVSQMLKMGITSAAAIPKAIMTAAAIPYIIQIFALKNKPKSDKQVNINAQSKNLTFKRNDKLAQNIAKLLNKKNTKDFSEKHKDSNFIMHIIALSDILSTATFITQIKNSKKIKEERKNALMYNAGISTGLCLASGYVTDKLLDKPAETFIKNYKVANINDKNLDKQVQGIKIVKPLLILGTIYYILIPVLSTYFAELADKNTKRDMINNQK